MKKLLVALFTLFISFPVQAAPDCGLNPEECGCVAAIFHRPAQATDLTVIKPWPKIAQLGQRQYRKNGNKRFKVLAICIYYADFGNQSGPTAYNPIDDGRQLGLRYHVPTAGESHPTLSISWWRDASSANADQGVTDSFMGALDASEGLGLQQERTDGRTAHKRMDDSTVNFIGAANQTAIDDAITSCLQQTVGAIWDEILLNGCP